MQTYVPRLYGGLKFTGMGCHVGKGIKLIPARFLSHIQLSTTTTAYSSKEINLTKPGTLSRIGLSNFSKASRYASSFSTQPESSLAQ